MSVNKVILVGRIGDEVKMHHFDNGGCIARFPLATNESYTNKETNEKVESTEWHQIIVSNKKAEIIEKYVKKGDQIYVEGKIKTRKWQDTEGKDRYSTEIHVFNFSFLSNNNSDNTTQQTTTSQPSGNGYSDDGDSDNLPFK